MRYQWAEIKFEGDLFDVCIDTRFDEVDEIRAVDSEINLINVMDKRTIDWFEEKALAEIAQEEASITAELNTIYDSMPLGFTLKKEVA